ncbi:hypothetical protein BRADI_5g17295v3 [Brachypodium distachyon]|uniref:Uncharacterized protein n=1 Tax=Brachypodium distachyon TaxID=15368 RepID=A0A2K2CHT0_BRADI|nr:hypothetical protein BRADI_5g17295v3 [Brachypodium distachyon]
MCNQTEKDLILEKAHMAHTLHIYMHIGARAWRPVKST